MTETRPHAPPSAPASSPRLPSLGCAAAHATCLALALAPAAGCFPGHKSSSPPPPPVVSYVDAAIDPSHFFRWTPRNSDPDTIVPVEVDDVNLPPGITPEVARATYLAARDVWRHELDATGFNTSSRFLSADAPFDSGRFVLRVHYVPNLTGQLVGIVGSQFTTNTMVQLDLRVAILDPQTGARRTDLQLRQTMTHELGHALGYDGLSSGKTGHSPTATDIMFAGLGPSTPNLLSGSDQMSIRDLYARTPQVRRRAD